MSKAVSDTKARVENPTREAADEHRNSDQNGDMHAKRRP